MFNDFLCYFGESTNVEYTGDLYNDVNVKE